MEQRQHDEEWQRTKKGHPENMYRSLASLNESWTPSQSINLHGRSGPCLCASCPNDITNDHWKPKIIFLSWFGTRPPHALDTHRLLVAHNELLYPSHSWPNRDLGKSRGQSPPLAHRPDVCFSSQRRHRLDSVVTIGLVTTESMGQGHWCRSNVRRVVVRNQIRSLTKTIEISTWPPDCFRLPTECRAIPAYPHSLWCCRFEFVPLLHPMAMVRLLLCHYLDSSRPSCAVPPATLTMPRVPSVANNGYRP
mmetsp:Transcript_14947/g.30814  ORF Transcript_14947/g.30814 Transcript_14947/m.30814 type:complete len:250 (-) Transcript_14947:40-789(-)